MKKVKALSAVICMAILFLLIGSVQTRAAEETEIYDDTVVFQITYEKTGTNEIDAGYLNRWGGDWEYNYPDHTVCVFSTYYKKPEIGTGESSYSVFSQESFDSFYWAYVNLSKPQYWCDYFQNQWQDKQVFSPEGTEWFEYYLNNILSRYHCVGDYYNGSVLWDAPINTTVINGITYYYVIENGITVDKPDSYTVQNNQLVMSESSSLCTANFFRAAAWGGDIFLELEFCYTPGFVYDSIEDALYRLLETVTFPTGGSAPDVLAEETAEGEETHRNEVQVVSVYPETGLSGKEIAPSVELTFSHEIEKINFETGSIWLCEEETGERVYWPGYLSAGSVQRGEIRFEKKWLWWSLPAHYAYSPLEPGKTYYLQIDEGVLEFADTGQSISITGPDIWSYTIEKLEYEDAFDVNFSYMAADGGGAKVDTVPYDDRYFAGSSYEYNSNLTLLSLGMAMSAYNADPASKGYAHVYQLMEDMNFSRISYNEDYAKTPDVNTTGVCIGAKQITDDTTLLAVAVRGGNYQKEWAGNFLVGDQTEDHEGFGIGRDHVIAALKSYLTEGDGRRISGNIKLWIVGYSRGSAIANLTAAALDDGILLSSNVTYSNSDVYAYCFAVPANTTSEKVSDSRYHNIFNIINPTDVVPRVALHQWGFSRYGINLYFPWGEDAILYGESIYEMQENGLDIYNSSDSRLEYCMKAAKVEAAVAERAAKVMKHIEEIGISHYAEYYFTWLCVLNEQEPGVMKQMMERNSHDSSTLYYRLMVEP